MNDVLRGHLGKLYLTVEHVLVYHDDILVFSKTPEEHARHLEQVLATLLKSQLHANPKNCSFNLREVNFLVMLWAQMASRLTPRKLRWFVPGQSRLTYGP